MVYLDTSAFLKLVVAEVESRALRDALREEPVRVSSALLVVESLRATQRHSSAATSRARAALDGVTLIPVDDAVLLRAAGLRPPELRSLDAIHVATALSLVSELSTVCCYDARLTAAAEAAGLRVVAPA